MLHGWGEMLYADGSLYRGQWCIGQQSGSVPSQQSEPLFCGEGLQFRLVGLLVGWLIVQATWLEAPFARDVIPFRNLHSFQILSAHANQTKKLLT